MSYIKTGCEDERDIAYMQYLEKKLHENPNDVQVLMEKGFLCVWPFCREIEGVELLKRAVELDPTNVEAYFWLAKGIYHGLCDHEEAKKILEKALMLDPNRADCLNLLADIVEDQEEAIILLQRAVQAQPDFLWVRLRLASYLLQTNKLDEAEYQANEMRKIYDFMLKTNSFPKTKNPLEDYYENFTGRYPEFKNDVDNFFAEISQKRQELYGTRKNQ